MKFPKVTSVANICKYIFPVIHRSVNKTVRIENRFVPSSRAGTRRLSQTAGEPSSAAYFVNESIKIRSTASTFSSKYEKYKSEIDFTIE